MRETLSFFWEITKIVIIALAIVIPIRYFIFQPFLVKGHSMEPNFEAGDYLIVEEVSYRFRDPHRGEVIVFRYPQNPSKRYIKRIIGLPGETVEVRDGNIFLNNNLLSEENYLQALLRTPGNILITLNENEYFVLGDNRFASYDSRRWGALPGEDIIGRAFIRAWPITALEKIEAPIY